MSNKVIIGIDPGTNILGYGIIRIDSKGPHYVDMGIFDLRKIKEIGRASCRERVS